MKKIFSKRLNRLSKWGRKKWEGKYKPGPERLLSPRFRDAKCWLWFGWVFCALSFVLEILFPCSLDEVFARSGPVLITCGLLIELHMLRAGSAIDNLISGTVLLNGEWDLFGNNIDKSKSELHSKKINGIPATRWIRIRSMWKYKYDRSVFWLVLIGTPIWGYGDLIV